MAEIWRKDDGKWSTIGPSGFVNEAELHQQIVEAPELLPIAGQRRIIGPFSEVGLGGGSADVLAFTDMGRPVVIEVKLKRNNEAKRAVVAQTLGYAAYLHGVTVEELEEDILAQPKHLGGRKLADVIEETDANSIDRDEFYENLTQHLAEGSFRLVIVLDEAPEYLVRLMGYLETITTDRISIDLVTVSAYEVNGAQILVPQRIDPEREPEREVAPVGSRRRSKFARDSGLFRESLVDLADERRQRLTELADWADSLMQEGLCRIESFRGKSGRFTLLMRLPGEQGGFSVIYNEVDASGWEGMMTLNRSVIERHAPGTLPRIESIAGRVGQGTNAEPTPELLDALADAYREAAGTA